VKKSLPFLISRFGLVALEWLKIKANSQLVEDVGCFFRGMTEETFSSNVLNKRLY
jgi:hypothetical protein